MENLSLASSKAWFDVELVRDAGFRLKYQIMAKVTEPGRSVTVEYGNLILES